MISLLKKIPVDLGQAEFKHDTAGKRIAFSYVPKNGLNKKALDIGCRDGYWSEELKKLGYQVVSLDIDPNYEGALVCDIEKGMPFEDKNFDLIWCTEVVEHLRNPKFTFWEIERIKKNSGVSIITTPNSHFWIYPIMRLWGWTPQKVQNPDHKQFFNLSTVSKIFEGYKVFGYFPYIFLFFKITKLVNLLSPTFILVKGSK